MLFKVFPNSLFSKFDLALVTGSIGKAFTDVNPLRGQNNVQASCDMGALPNVYPGYQKVDRPENQEKLESAWGIKLFEVPGLTHSEIFAEILQAELDPSNSWVKIRSSARPMPVMQPETMEKVDFFVVRDIFLTESAKLADVVLPAATFAEKDGTFTNAVRRVQRIRQAGHTYWRRLPLIQW